MIETLTDNLYKILTTTIPNNRLYGARILGFRSELEFVRDFIKSDENFLNGGQFIFGKNDSVNVTDRKLMYVTISSEEPSRYIGFYKELKKFPLCGKLFFFQYKNNLKDWKEVVFKMKDTSNKKFVEERILEPSFDFFEFKDDGFVKATIETFKNELVSKNGSCAVRKNNSFLEYLKNYSEDEVAQIYANRFFLDVILRDRKKGMIDIDGIWFNGKEYKLIELKEKDPGPKNRMELEQDKWYFGWDSRRIAWYLFIMATTGISTLYALREVNNQKDRKFVAWKYMLLEDFARNAAWGVDTGPTITSPYNLFQNLESLKKF